MANLNSRVRLKVGDRVSFKEGERIRYRVRNSVKDKVTWSDFGWGQFSFRKRLTKGCFDAS